jgi:hypothetical protein
VFGDFEVRVQLARERYAALLREAEIARRLAEAPARRPGWRGTLAAGLRWLADRLDPGGRALIPETVAGER